MRIDPTRITIRPARADDALCLRVLGMQVFLDTYATGGIRPSLAREVLAEFSVEALDAALAAPHTVWRLAEHDAHLVGFAQLRLRAAHALAPPGVPCELHRLYVQSPFGGCGLGTRLLRAVEDVAVQAGAGLCWLKSWSQNSRALAFYACHGYADLGGTWYEFEGESYENRLLAKALDSSAWTSTPG